MAIIALIGVVIALASVIVAQQVGLIQTKALREANALNRRLASPKIASTVRVEQRYDNGRNFPPWFYLLTTISNEGQLAADDLRGEWKLVPTTREIAERTIPIHLDSLGSSQPYQVQEVRLESGLGPGVWTSRGGSNTIQFAVTIELTCRGLTDQPERYTARNEYDNSSQQMVRVPS
ncbi:MAG TPA: hypothetical protein VNX88_01035 [Terriglobales bacterium]|jgi:hypothetical protein|nr:hypothetical protein [Terriglobales bacterium]